MPALAADAWLGSPLSGPRAGELPDEPAWRYLGLRARALSSAWAGGATDTDSPPLSSEVTLIRRPGSPEAYEPFTELGEWLRVSPASLAPWARDDGLEAAAWFAIAPGSTTEVVVAPCDTVDVALQVGLDAAGEPTLAVRARREDVGAAWLALDVAPPVDGAAVALLVPAWPLGERGGDPVAISARLASSPPPGFDAARLADEARARLTRPPPEPEALAPRPAPTAPPWPSLDEALKAVGHPATRRSALVWLGASTGARLTEEVALMADSALLRALAATVAEEPSAPRDRLAVRLEHATIAALEAVDTLDDAVYAVAVQWAGAAVDELGLIEELMVGMDELSDLDELLATENAYALDDASPATRLRALDWLEARGEAPQGFAVFDDAETRRAALEAWEAER